MIERPGTFTVNGNFMNKRIARFGCILALLPLIPAILLWSWQAKTKCQIPFLPVVPSTMPKDISGLLARMESYRYWERNMPSWWELKTALPHPTGDYTDAVKEIAAQDQNIWLRYFSFVQRYDINSGKRFTYRSIDDGKAIKGVEHILVTQAGDVWAFVRLDTSFALVYFDKETDSFKIIQDRNNLFSNWKDMKFFNPGSNLEETSDGNILIPFQKNIFLYTPKENVVQQLLPKDFGLTVNSLAVSGDSLWFTVVETNDLWRLDLSTKKTTNYGPAPQEYHGPIVVDRLGRVWLGYFARFEPADKQGRYQWWYPESYPPEFIALAARYEDSLSGEDELHYFWSAVTSVNTTSDGSIWFSTSAGLVKYDINENDWCSSAPEITNSVAEDKDGNLWMVPISPRYLGLYKYKLQQ